VKNKFRKLFKRRACRKCPGIRFPDSSTNFRLVKKVRSTGHFLDKKYTGQVVGSTEVT
jgi:RNase P subunit RPR2